jgi:hypothetical protein
MAFGTNCDLQAKSGKNIVRGICYFCIRRRAHRSPLRMKRGFLSLEKRARGEPCELVLLSCGMPQSMGFLVKTKTLNAAHVSLCALS